MRILHLLSNWKWTERSEPAADLALTLQDAGHDVTFGCCGAPDGIDKSVAWHAREKGLRQVIELDLPKHLNVLRLARQVRGAGELISQASPDVVHCHMQHAHFVAARARRDAAAFKLVRSSYDPQGTAESRRDRRLMRRHCDGVVVISERAAQHCRNQYGYAAGQVLVSEPGIDLARFDPGRVLETQRGFPPAADGFVVGMVTRIRAGRRLDLVLEAVSRLAAECPQLHLLVVGRGRDRAEEEVVREPAARLGISDRIHLAGYCTGDELVAAYRAMDVLAYPEPGTDRSCRTVREAMASGLSVIACRTGFLPDLVEDRGTGQLVTCDAEAVAGALRDCVQDSRSLANRGAAALAAARQRFDLQVQARRIIELYERLGEGDA